ncbi:scaffold attachment factor B2-like isoform X2 [Zootermopsis nevadensis]|nr:scaffold attachment factor B2-like isoform X2 [Zootermopsis nevadensis]
MASDSERRKLVDLRVVDLRAELERRNLDKTGVKAVLIERLQKALRGEGHDSEEYFFESSEKKISKRSSITKRSEQDAESETQSIAEENHNADVDEEHDADMDEDVKKEEADNEDGVPAQVTDNKTVVSMPEPVTDGVEVKVKDEARSQAEEVGIDVDKNVPEANGVDNEDSINLTIGEDEEKLLAEEEDSSSQEKETKDEDSAVAGLTQQEAGGDASKKDSLGQEENKRTSEEESLSKSQEEHSDDKSGGGSKSSVAAADSKATKDEKVEKKSKLSVGGTTSGSSRNLWVSGLSSSTRATDLKQVFSKYGKVIGAKVVTNARTPGARCYGYVTMATSDDASKCIQHLHRTELHGRMISVERAKGDATGPPRKNESKVSGSSVKRAEEKKRHERRLSASVSAKQEASDKEEKRDREADLEVLEVKDEAAKDGTPSKMDGDQAVSGEDKDMPGKMTDGLRKEGGKHQSREVSRERRDRHRSAGSSHYSHHSRSPNSQRCGSRHLMSPSRKLGVLTFAQIREERERQRQREHERELREEDRRRRNEVLRQREIEKMHREEAMRLEREKEKLRIERERIERERNELMRMERERQRLERERLEREREELKRQQMRFEESRRTTKRPSSDRRDSYPDERKRVATERRYDGPGRFDEGARFERGPSFRVRDERRSDSDHRSKVDVRHSRDRYPDSSKGESRYTDRSGDTWHTGGGPPPAKPFSSMGSGGVPPRDSWGPSSDRKGDSSQNWGRPIDAGTSERWVTSSGGPMGVVGRGGPSMGGPGSVYSSPQNVTSNMSGMNMGMSSSGGPYGGDRFDAYKQSMGPIRKY